MTHEELIELAKTGGYVRWTKSGLIEYIWAHGEKVMARGLFTRRHFITTFAPPVNREHFCEPIDRSTLIGVGEQYDAAKKTTWFRG